MFPENMFFNAKTTLMSGEAAFYQLFQIGFVFPFSVTPLHLMLTLPPKAFYHTVSFQSSDNFLNSIFFLH